MILFASCTDELENRTNKYIDVQFALDVESNLTTRAISDGSQVTQLMYAVFDENGNVDPSTPIMWDYDTVTSAIAYPVGDAPITISGGTFITRANAAPRQYTYYGAAHPGRAGMSVCSHPGYGQGICGYRRLQSVPCRDRQYGA